VASREQVAALIRGGEWAAAKVLLDEMARSDRRNVDTWYTLGIVNHHLGALEEAVRCHEKALRLDPNHPEALYWLGNLRLKNQDREGAIRCYRKALLANPRHEAATRNLGATLQDLQRSGEAIDCYRRFLEQGIASAGIWFNLGNAFFDGGAREKAIAAYRQALALDPRYLNACINLGIALDESGDLDGAAGQYEKALAVEPGSALAWRLLAAVRAEQGMPQDAMARYRQALTLAPHDALRLRLAMLLPAVPASLDDLRQWRERFETEIDRLADEPLSLADPAAEIGGTNFYLSYHGLSNRELHRKVAALYERACPALRWTAPHCEDPKPPRGKIRVGFISRHLYDHSIGKTTRGLLEKLSREQFEVYSLFAPPVREDAVAKLIRASSDRSVALPRSLDAARRLVAGLELDILFYQDIGMEPFTYFLAFSRLAPVQCVSFGHPDTTGIGNMDYFISNDRFETAGAAQHYSERLFLLRDLGSLAYYYRPRPPEVMKRREDFGLPAGANLYLCPQTLFKVHPELDAMLAGILRADPRGVVVLIRSKVSNWTELLAARFHRAMPDVAGRIVFVPGQDLGGFLNLLAVADVVLDTLHFNGMNSSLESFSVGAPVVTLPTALQRGRHTAGMYRKMDFADCVAADPDDYVRIAVRLGTEEDYRRYVRNEILRRNEVLFEDMRVVREFERCFLETVQAPRPHAS
jgi:predicted O-linked N-acetylglucosamine transferase (SPINDLY family)